MKNDICKPAFQQEVSFKQLFGDRDRSSDSRSEVRYRCFWVGTSPIHSVCFVNGSVGTVGTTRGTVAGQLSARPIADDTLFLFAVCRPLINDGLVGGAHRDRLGDIFVQVVNVLKQKMKQNWSTLFLR